MKEQYWELQTIKYGEEDDWWKMIVCGMKSIMVSVINCRSFRLEIVLCLRLCHGMNVVKMIPNNNDICISDEMCMSSRVIKCWNI